ncbi:hypothetical protein Goari_019787, partial [Gossypium aridum]|nr:hypothetical protein [Gossypium aridum]
WNNDKSHVGIPNELEDIRLLLDQRSKAEFEWISFSDLKFQECIPTKFLANHNIWHAIVPLIVFAMVEMHEFDRVMRQFEFMQSIPHHTKSSMNFPRSTCGGKPMKIGLNSMQNISTSWSIWTIPYLCANQLSDRI